MVISGADTAAYAHGVPSDVDYREIPALMPLPGSTASGILTYNNTSASGTSATISVTPNDNDALIQALNDHEFQLMTSQEIDDWINEVWVTHLEIYSGAVSIFDALGGGPLTPTASNPIWSDRNSFGGSANIVSSGFGLYGDSNQVTCKIPVGSYELDGFARAVARQAMADSTVNFHGWESLQSSVSHAYM